VDESANYAHYDELRKVKAPFVAHHYEGCEYGGVTYACDGKSIKEWAMDHEGFEIVYMSSVDLKTGILRKDVIREYRSSSTPAESEEAPWLAGGQMSHFFTGSFCRSPSAVGEGQLHQDESEEDRGIRGIRPGPVRREHGRARVRGDLRLHREQGEQSGERC